MYTRQKDYVGHIDTLPASEVNAMTKAIQYRNTIWEGKTILWLGTSIPDVGLYPELTATNLNFTLINESLATSSMRATKMDGSHTGLYWLIYCLSLSQTTIEKQYIIDNWSTIRLDFDFSNQDRIPPVTLTTEQQNAILNSSYQVKITPNLNADLFVFDHGFNDLWWDSTSAVETIPPNTRDRGYMIGAFNYLVDYILTNRPFARIILIGHHENKNAHSVYLCSAQSKLATQWNFPLLKTWEKTGFSLEVIQSTGLTVLNTWIPDGIHPSSDTTGKTKILYSNIITNFLQRIF